jgi:hypothetical protein
MTRLVRLGTLAGPIMPVPMACFVLAMPMPMAVTCLVLPMPVAGFASGASSTGASSVGVASGATPLGADGRLRHAFNR